MRLTSFLTVVAALTLWSGAASAANLADVFRDAMASDPVLGSAEYDRYAAEGDRSAVCGRLWPQVKATAGYTYFDQDSPGSVVGDSSVSTNAEISGQQGRVSIGVGQTLFDMPKFSECRAARIGADRGAVRYEQALEDLIYRTVQAYVGVLGAEDSARTARAKYELYETQYGEASKGYDVAKTVSKLQLSRASERWQDAAAEKASAEKAEKVARAALAEITGEKPQPGGLDDLRTNVIIPLPENAPDHWKMLARKQNLRLLESAMTVRIAKYGKNAAYGEMWPAFDMFAKHSWYDNNLNRAGPDLASDDDGFQNEAVGVTMSMPLFTGGSNYGAASAAKNRYKSAAMKHEAVARNVDTEVEGALAGLYAFYAALMAAEAGANAADANLKATRGGLKAKTKTGTDMLDAKSRVLEAGQKLAAARFDYVLGVLDFWRAIGALSYASIDEVNALLEGGSALRSVPAREPDSPLLPAMDAQSYERMEMRSSRAGDETGDAGEEGDAP